MDERTEEERQAHRALARAIIVNDKHIDVLATFGADPIDCTKFGDLDCGDQIEAALVGLSKEVVMLVGERVGLEERVKLIVAANEDLKREVVKMKADAEALAESHDAAGWDHAERSEMQADEG